MSSTTFSISAPKTAHLRCDELAALVAWGDRHHLEVTLKPSSANSAGKMAFIGYGEGIAAWSIYWIKGLLWLAFLPDPSGEGSEGWTVAVETVDEAMKRIIAATEV